MSAGAGLAVEKPSSCTTQLLKKARVTSSADRAWARGMRKNSGDYDQTQKDLRGAEPSDGYRVLVDRLWPRGVRKSDAKLDGWLKDLAPSTGLRKWFEHDPKKWPEFQMRYRAELNSKTHLLQKLIADAANRDITLVYASREQRCNNVTVLREVIDELLAHENRA